MILIVAARDLEPQIMATLRDEFAMTRQNTRDLLFDRDPNEVLKFKYNLRNSYLDITRLVYLNTAVGRQELDRIKAVADFAAQGSLPMAFVSPYSLLAVDDQGDFLRAAATYIEGVVPQHFIIALAPLDGSRLYMVAAELSKLPESGWFGRYHIKIAGRGLALEPVTRKDAPHSVRKRMDRSELGG
jgi:hypothetical protein